MDPGFHEEMLRLQQYRQNLLRQGKHPATQSAAAKVGSGSASSSNPDEASAQNASGRATESGTMSESLHDPLMYPGLYSPSGFDMMGILVRVRQRSNPVIEIGNIDSSVALVLCDTTLLDMPIVYCSETFCLLTGYTTAEVLGRNCRFLQHPFPQHPLPPAPFQTGNLEPMVQPLNVEARAELKKSFAIGGEARVRLVNYKKTGEKFINLLSCIPITWEEGEANSGPGKRYIVGFQADWQQLFGK